MRAWVRALTGAGIALGCVLGFAQTGRTTMDGVYTEAQAERGRTLYADQCVECHGHDLEGKYESAALEGDQFRSDWEGQNLFDLTERIRITMSGDMAGRISTGTAPPLTRKQSVDLVAFLLWFNKMPAGKSELGTEEPVLRGITFKSPPPPAK